MDILSDSYFEQYAAQSEQEAKRSRFSVAKDYEDIHWTGLSTEHPTVIRVVGAPPNTSVSPEVDKYSCKKVTICWVTGDDGKKFRIIRPDFGDDRDYILNKIISKVKEVKWSKDGNKEYVVKTKYPEIFNMVDKNGLQPTDQRFKFEKGWQGREVLIMNVIDRARMEEHRNYNHTFLLAKSVVTGENGNEFVDEGVSSFALDPYLTRLFKAYGNWQKYDIAITRTGRQNPAFEVINASEHPREVAEPYRQYISSSTEFTEEEKNFETYDLSKLFRVTTNTKIFNRLKGTISRIDAALNTHFLDELKVRVEKEKELFDKMYNRNGEEESDSDHFVEEKVVEEVPQVTSRVATRPVSKPVENRAGSDLPYYNLLSEELKSQIISAKPDKNIGDEYWDIKWNVDEDRQYACPRCSTPSPESATHCPACGEKFE